MPTLAETNRKAIKDLLTTRHGFKLTRDDVQTMDHVFDVFAAFGGYTELFLEYQRSRSVPFRVVVGQTMLRTRS